MLNETVINLNPKVDPSTQPMFFGEKLGLSRFDKPKYNIFKKLTAEQKKNFWNPEDINLAQDSIDYNQKLASMPNAKHIFDSNIAYQTLLDSIQSRATVEALIPWISLPELEDCVGVWGFFERIHNLSYQWIEQNLKIDPSEFFDEILNNTNIVSRAEAIVRYYDDLINYSNKVRVFGYRDIEVDGEKISLSLIEHKRKMYRAVVSIYALESIRFYVSFCCTFALGQQELMRGNADEMKLIQRDENLHVGISLNILRLWPKDDSDFAEIAKEEESMVYEIFKEVVEQEREWAKYLFKHGPLLGLNEQLLGNYLEHLANKRLKAIGLEQIFPNKTNPFNWLKNWISSDEEQRAPQEVEIIDYKVSALDGTVDESSLDLDF